MQNGEDDEVLLLGVTQRYELEQPTNQIESTEEETERSRILKGWVTAGFELVGWRAK